MPSKFLLYFEYQPIQMSGVKWKKTTKLTHLLIEFSLVFLWRVFPFLGLYRMWCLINFTNRTGTWKLSHFVCCSTPGLQLSSSTLRATHTLPRKYSVGLGRGSFKQVCSNCATCDLPSQFLLYFEYQPRKWVVSREKTDKPANWVLPSISVKRERTKKIFIFLLRIQCLGIPG